MKYFFFLIVMLNLLIFLWQYKTQPLPNEQVSEPAENKQQIRLMREIDTSSKASEAESEQQ